MAMGVISFCLLIQSTWYLSITHQARQQRYGVRLVSLALPSLQSFLFISVQYVDDIHSVRQKKL